MSEGFKGKGNIFRVLLRKSLQQKRKKEIQNDIIKIESHDMYTTGFPFVKISKYRTFSEEDLLEQVEEGSGGDNISPAARKLSQSVKYRI